MRKFLFYLLLLSLTTIVISACGSKSMDSTSDSSPTYVSIFQLRPDIGNGQVTLEWLSEPTAKTYNIYVGTSETSLSKVAANVVSAPFTVTGLSNDTAYYFSVSGSNDSGEEGPLGVPIAVPPSATPPPPAPENVRANAGNQQLTVTWTPVTASPAVTSYNIYCQCLINGTNMNIAVVQVNGQANNSQVVKAGTITSWIPSNSTETGIVNDRLYNCWVSAVNTDGKESSESFISAATPKAAPRLSHPIIFTSYKKETVLLIFTGTTLPVRHIIIFMWVVPKILQY